MIVSISPEELPRRISNQILEITRKNLETFIKQTGHLNTQEISKLKKDPFFLFIIFRMSCKKIFKTSLNVRVSIPFGFKPASKNFLDTGDTIKNLQKTHISGLKKPKFLEKSRNDKRRFSKFSFIRDLLFFFLRNFSQGSFSPFIINWQGKSKEKKEWKKLEKPIILRLIKALSCLYLKKINFFSFGLKYKRPDCAKQVTNNILQTIGGIYENVFRRKFELQKINFKNQNSLQFSYFFSFL